MDLYVTISFTSFLPQLQIILSQVPQKVMFFCCFIGVFVPCNILCSLIYEWRLRATDITKVGQEGKICGCVLCDLGDGVILM